MSSLKEKALEEAKQVVSKLSLETPKGSIFQFEAFIQGLSEEIQTLWESGTKYGFAHFHLTESGSLTYEGLEEKESVLPTTISLPILFRPDTHSSSTLKLAEEYLQLDIAAKKNKLLDKLLNEGKSSEDLQK